MYVFGIDLPIMELLFVFLVFFVVALVVIWLEVRKLRKLIGREEEDIGIIERRKR
jgi:hypothetical protein